ncbi:MAG: fibronectin type III domain-containing protein [Clostridia bacterium]|nr:fibronectin type III domain-containing protein [Clostridia bacterium]
MERQPNYRFAGPRPDHIMVSIYDDAKTTMAVTWRTDCTVTGGYLEYGEAGKERKKETATTEPFKSDVNTSNIHFVRLKNLRPGTRYYYTCGDSENRSAEYYFETEEENLTHFKFLCIADHQKDDDHYNPDYSALNAFLKEVFRENPDLKFILTAGDNNNCGQHEIQWNAMYEGLEGIIEYRPYMMACGNHDNRGFEFYFPEEKNRYYAEPAEFFNTQHRLSYPLNGPEGWQTENYSFNYGNAHFNVFGVNEPELVNTWAAKDIDSCGKTWKFGSYHFPMYYAGPNLSNDDGYPMMRECMEKLDVLFSGHEHNFSRTYPIRNEQLFDKPSQGTVHYQLGNGDFNPPGCKTCDKIWHCAFYPQEEKVSAYTIVEVNGNKLTLTSKLNDGRIVDECVIDKDKDEILPRRIAPVFGPGRTRIFYKGVDPGLCMSENLPVNKDGLWFVPFGTLVAFMGGDVLREKGKITISVYGRKAVFYENSDIAETDKGEVRLEAPVFRGKRDRLYIPLDGASKIFGMKWAYAERNNYLTLESSNESFPVAYQP